jgi:hypothetical protein
MDKEAVLAVLRQSQFGFAKTYARWSTGTSLTRFQRLFNWLAKKLGADQTPFTDQFNFSRCEVLSLKSVANVEAINEAMRELADSPVCKVCGSKNLVPDPAGYYCDAVNYDGGPLMCMIEHGRISFKPLPTNSGGSLHLC